MIHSFGSIILFAVFCFGIFDAGFSKTAYRWSNVTPSASYPQGYNYPVFVFGDWMVALNNGAWLSNNGKKWVRTGLPESGSNSAYQKYVQFNGAIYVLGSFRGNYEEFTITSKILRTTDFEKWETLSESSNLPHRIFYGAAVFKNKMWLLGGYDGEKYYSDVWNSPDGINWTRVAEKSGWSPRNAGAVAVFKDRLGLIGGGEIDGQKVTNPNSRNEIWSSADGREWKLETSQIAGDSRFVGGSVGVYDGKLWLVGTNRANEFQSGVLYSEDGRKWHEMKAPWSPRGAVAVWIFNDKLFMTGGKSSHTENGEIKFVYSNDVWAMERKAE
ncbi:MAG: hypothetical protein ACT4O9_02040 [Blastocatellia bacterium]